MAIMMHGGGRLLALLLCIFIHGSTVEGQVTCDTSDPTIRAYGSNCYQFMSSPPNLATWNRATAAQTCEGLGSGYYLATVQSAAEQNWLQGTLSSSFQSFDRTYIGGMESEGEWTWQLDGSVFEMAFKQCFVETTRSEMGNPLVVRSTMTQCIDYCKDLNTQAGQLLHNYAGARAWTYGGDAECFCNAETPETQEMPESSCNSPCSGNTEEICGGFDSNNSPAYIWVESLYEGSSAASDSVYTHWAADEPNGDTTAFEWCVSLKGEHWQNYKWADEVCSNPHPYICQYAQYTSQSSCEGAYFIWEDNTCFQTNNEELNFFAARYQCMEDGGDLAMVNTEALDTLFAAKAADADSEGNYGARNWWIGLSKISWTWNGEQTEAMTYTNFAPYQPDDQGTACLVISRNGGGADLYGWEDYSCDMSFPFICEYTSADAASTTDSLMETSGPQASRSHEEMTTARVEATSSSGIITTRITMGGATTDGLTTTTPSFTSTDFTPSASDETTTTSTTTTSTTSTTTTATTTSSTTTSTTTTAAAAASTTSTTTTEAAAGASSTAGVPQPASTTTTTSTTSTTTTSASGGGADATTFFPVVTATTTNVPPTSAPSSDEPIFTTGIIAAIVIALVAVLIGFIRLLVYCCQRRSGLAATNFDVEKSKSSSPLRYYDNPGLLYDSSRDLTKTTDSPTDVSIVSPGATNSDAGSTTPPTATPDDENKKNETADMDYAY